MLQLGDLLAQLNDILHYLVRSVARLISFDLEHADEVLLLEERATKVSGLKLGSLDALN